MTDPHPHLKLWKRAYEKGYAGALADQIIRQRPVPDNLIAAIMKTERPTKFHLSRRKREIIYLLSVGWNKRQIAKALNLSEETIKSHVAQAGSELGVRGQTAIVVEAIRRFEII